jgi:Saxitoxin biosynthesis operon protein SxtJ
MHENPTSGLVAKGSSNRTFGFVFAGFFVLIGAAPLLFGRPIHLWSLALAAAFGVIAAVVPVVLAPLNRVWTRFGLLLHKIVSPVVLGLMFFFLITPIGVIRRALGNDSLRLRPDPRASTYWINRTPPGPPPETFTDQF